jgi:hypothetical protein
VASVRRWLRAVKEWPWPDIGLAAGVVVAGFTQPVMGLVRENADYFPKEGWFHLALLAWTAALPFAGVLAVDLGLARWTKRGRAFAAWRAGLCAFLFASMLRQAQVYYPAPFQAFLERFPPLPFVVALLALVFFAALRWRDLAHRYVATFGLLALLLLGRYVVASGLLGPAWRGPGPAPAAAAGVRDDGLLLILIFDELSNDSLLKDGRIDEDAFPNFAALAKESARFTAAHANYIATKDALPSMLTGRLSPDDRVPRLFDYLPGGPEVRVHTFFPPTYGWLRRNARPGQTLLLEGRVEDPLDGVLKLPGVLVDLFEQTPFSRSPFGVTPARRILPRPMRRDKDPHHTVPLEAKAFLAALEAARPGDRLVWHAAVPHFPFLYNPDGSPHGSVSNELLGPASLGSKSGRPPGYEVAQALDNYRKMIGYADHLLGQMVAVLKRSGLYERSTLVVTSDHGLRTWGAIEPVDWSREFAGSIARVPLMIRGPRVKAGAYDVDYQQVDFTPTVLEALGLSPPAGAFEGVSGFAASRPERPKRLMDSHGRPFAYDPARDVWVAR